ncbi:GNAT family N-acetyltransferase [Streptomyces sp. H10-C2]|uniref:GNAT family N-acetyltransferase n=1 Tax=unclassified Streptomyces TaxID=2593676 RepID=UPI0024B924AF|nr:MULTISPECIES: GNAT family N-acetyltransferase [unclassified Streptomyces]MDJ0344157.1 GNAT family N-acetyltransferase [Streptomyces sp. PH10-H1]MDJ0373084.1 GNAT family N-acetyltransferase [Streptomyces sp. H10-C2]
MPEIVRLEPKEFADHVGDLAALLAGTVGGGASVGFLAPLDHGAAARWWEGLAPAVHEGHVIVWVAGDGERITGTVQLRPSAVDNGRHRAEIAKLMVHGEARGQGIARRLLAAAEEFAAAAGITLLILDTVTGSPAERLYTAAGWTPVGSVPGYAADPAGTLQPTTIFYKAIAAG